MTWQSLLDKVGIEGLKEYFGARGIAMVNWTQTIGMTDIWRQVGKQVLPGLREDPDSVR